MAKRRLLGYEINHLLRFGKYPLNLDESDQTPVELLTGQAQFLGRYYGVTKDTLIPREETGELVVLLSQIIKKTFSIKTQLNLLDVGCGTGCVGISLVNLLDKFGQIQCDFSDVSRRSLAVCQKNCQKLFPPDKQFYLYKSDLLLDLPDKEFDVIVANLPYIPSSRIPMLSPSVRDYEPLLALDGGPRGLKQIKRLLTQISQLTYKPRLVGLEVDLSHDLADLPLLPDYQAKSILSKETSAKFFIYQLNS